MTRLKTAGYDEEARYFEVGVRSSKREELTSKALQEVRRPFKQQISLLQRRCFEIAKEALSQADSDTSNFLSLATMYPPPPRRTHTQRHPQISPKYLSLAFM